MEYRALLIENKAFVLLRMCTFTPVTQLVPHEWMERIMCERDECSFILVQPTLRLRSPVASSAITSSMLCTVVLAIPMYICMNMRKYVYKYMRIHLYMYVYIHIHTYRYGYMCVYICTRTYTYIFIYICVTYMYTNIQALPHTPSTVVSPSGAILT